ncbi:MAG: alpha-amylase family glycosyl hydrolase [Inhella sp.]
MSPSDTPLRRVHRTLPALLALLHLLAACGGGGGGSTPPPAPPPAPAPSPAPSPPPLPQAPDLGEVTTADPGSPLPAAWTQGGFMQVFVRSYQDSDGDGIGDLRGLISRLDYLKELGISGLWLMPIARSQDGDHGYAVTHYRDIEAAYGSLTDLDELLRQAHARGIGVVLDYVLNHSAAQHPLFLQARTDPAAGARNWYLWQNPAPSGWQVFGANPWRLTANGAYYAPFWDQMPDWNLRNPEVLGFHRNNLRFWLNRGVDGFRFDAVGLLVENGPSAWENQPENHALMRDIAALVGGYQRRFMVCEAPAASRAFAESCGRAFAFDLSTDLMRAVSQSDPAAVARIAAYPSGTQVASFLSNHDEFAGQRTYDQLGGQLPALKLAASSHLLREGTPFIYYGEEVGMAGGAGLSGDPRLRSPMSWSADPVAAGFSTRSPYRALAANAATHNVALQQADPASLLNHYKALLALRRSESALLLGRQEQAQAQGAALGYWRVQGNERVLVLLNFGRSSVNPSWSGARAGATLRSLWPAGGADLQADANGRISLSLPPQSLLVLKEQP